MGLEKLTKGEILGNFFGSIFYGTLAGGVGYESPLIGFGVGATLFLGATAYGAYESDASDDPCGD